MDKIILGLLLLQSRTIYQLRERVNKGLNLMYSNSMGSIQAAIKKLIQNGYIEFTELVEEGRHKKFYSITEKGKEYFLNWINTPMSTISIKNPELVKLYFMGFSNQELWKDNIMEYIKNLNEQYEILKKIYDEGEQFQVPVGGEKIVEYQLLSAKYGMELMKFNIDWFSKLLSEIKEE